MHKEHYFYLTLTETIGKTLNIWKCIEKYTYVLCILYIIHILYFAYPIVMLTMHYIYF